ncbi:MAG TPA: hypothetical protein PKI14_07330 [Fervidobacterium sp.]|nr:hypothetical protein [Fervidobacterium sp.]HOQ39816.1 hypothetical protein [Fervidobacterium sp.]HPT54308.1 hypothetical protein [Fervidobacterium sp.]HPZ17773.1 hypothetical protein [Fervidobacterium sp.]HQE48915.1 hypothetical protein [Fervidobacterium sp.]
MIGEFLHIIFGSLISTLIGSLVSLLIAFEIVSKRSRIRYQPLFLFNEMMMAGVLILIWAYLDNLFILFCLIAALSLTYQLYKLLVGIYSIDKRFRLLVLSLGVDHREYARFTIERNLGRLFGNLLKFYTLSLVTFLVSMTAYASNMGFFAIIVGLILSLFQID